MKNYFTAVTVLVVTFSMFITSCTQPAKQSTLEKILAEKTIVVGTTGEQFPFSFKGENDELEGIDINIANYLANDLGVTVKYEVMDFDQLIPSVVSGKVDVVFSGVSITTERNTKVAFPGVYFKSGKSILTKSKKLSKGEAEFVNTESVTLVTVSGTTSEVFVKNRFPKAKLVLVENNSEAIKLLGEDKVHGIVADFETCEMLAFSYEDSFLYYNNISKSNEKEFISPVVAAGDHLFINLLTNYIKRINAVDKSEAVDTIWYKFAK
jgi:polar amino acid transport system substrate-binding protein